MNDHDAALAHPGAPTRRQRLLLDAALREGPAAIDAWVRWCEGGDLDDIDAGSFRLLPLVHHNLVRAARGAGAPADGAGEGRAPDLPELGRLQGIARHQWARSQVVTASAVEALGALQAADVEVVAVKGLPLAWRAYPRPALRPMVDLDLLVPRHDVARAAAVLGTLGYHPGVPLWHDDLPGVLATRHGAGFRRDDGREIDLHWELLPDGRRGLADAVRERAEPVVLAGVEVLVPCRTDQVLHTCVHGMRYDAVAPVRWVADLAHLLGADPDHADDPPPAIDWARLVDLADRTRSGRPTADALALWVALLERPDLVPATVVERVGRPARTPAGALDAWEYHARLRPPAAIGVAPTAALLGRIAWRARTAPDGVGPTTLLRHTWGVPPGTSLSAAAKERLGRKQADLATFRAAAADPVDG